MRNGGADRLLLGADRARAGALPAYGGMPGLAYLPQRVVPRLRESVGQTLAERILVENPARLLAAPTPAYSQACGGTR